MIVLFKRQERCLLSRKVICLESPKNSGAHTAQHWLTALVVLLSEFTFLSLGLAFIKLCNVLSVLSLESSQ